ncbi:hypothetical protein AB4K20DRAFT_1897729 [Rhizopus microsporus]
MKANMKALFHRQRQLNNFFFYIISCFPEMKKFELPFSSQLIATDVTYKAVKDSLLLLGVLEM